MQSMDAKQEFLKRLEENLADENRERYDQLVEQFRALLVGDAGGGRKLELPSQAPGME